ncbi:hypothetical protein D9611_006086 [Ephemerocybe angulata]|uniref:Uncharacterized protein n=1 Tax=Ephemerocybe angulata TaxID=980116 RepID=A0A8H5CG76_9AGAR|nr:hypothetical protein D9611_015085 [Tulosesus angulatus]KAF5341180.1 hypothetical protein D9611_006086 [Tulosesus angulatus]
MFHADLMTRRRRVSPHHSQLLTRTPQANSRLFTIQLSQGHTTSAHGDAYYSTRQRYRCRKSHIGSRSYPSGQSIRFDFAIVPTHPTSTTYRAIPVVPLLSHPGVMPHAVVPESIVINIMYS